MTKNLLHALLALGLWLGLCGPARAATPPASGRSLAEALNPDGTLKAGLNGSFDARAFRMGTAPDGRPVFRPAGVAGAGDERWQDGFGLANGVDGVVVAVACAGSDLYIGGAFSAIGSLTVNNVAHWDGTIWSALKTGAGIGVSDFVNALAIAANGNVYVGGTFGRAGGVAANNIARWNGTAWAALGTGAGTAVSSVGALAVAANGDVYMGGNFNQAGGVVANGVARWNGAVWAALGTGAANGVFGEVHALAVAANGDVYAGGYFSQAGGVAARNVARWNGTAWAALGAGVGLGYSDEVECVAVAGNGDVYAGGYFSQAGGVAASSVARWNGTAWTALGTGTANGVFGMVNALAVAANGDVYVGGQFIRTGGITVQGLARWDGTMWSTLGTGTGTATGASGYIRALALAGNGDLYAGGEFSQMSGVVAKCLARWNGTVWNAVSTSPANGVNGTVTALAVAGNGDIYMGGQFTQLGGTTVNSVARWNGTGWSSLGTGVANGISGSVTALAVAANGDVFAGGSFLRAGGVAANNIARWNGTSWSSLGTGGTNGLNGFVSALAIAAGGNVYVGGTFSQAGGMATENVARWDGVSWNVLPAGPSTGGGSTAVVHALAIASNGDVYAGGKFNEAGGMATSNIARWNGTSWSSVGTGTVRGVNDIVYALAIAPNGDVYVGGQFTQAGGVTAYGLVRWNGTTWNPLVASPVVAGIVYALAIAANGDLYAGGNINPNGTVANRIARWNGTNWGSLGTGLNGIVVQLAVGQSGKIHVGGDFTTTGDGSKVIYHFGIYDPNAPLVSATTSATRATPAAQLFPNPAHGTATLRLPAGAPRLALTLTDALGRTVRRYPAPAAGSEAELDLRGLPAGTYVVRCGPLSQRLVVE